MLETGTFLVKRTTDAAEINALINDPSIRPHVGGDGVSVLDLSAAVADPLNYFVTGEHGGFAFTWSSPSAYEVHTFILPAGRGAWAAAFALAARAFMAESGAWQLWTRVPVGHDNIRAYTEKAGFWPAGRQTIDSGGGPVPYDLYEWRPPCQ